MTSQPVSDRESHGPACSLNPAELEARLREWRALREDALIRESAEGRIVSSLYTRSEDVARRLQALIEAEGRCCAFLEFELYEEGEAIRVDLRLPDGMSAPVLTEPAAFVDETGAPMSSPGRR